MMQEFVLLLLLLIFFFFFWVSWISMLRPGIEPVISFTGVRDYARSAIASWTIGSPIFGVMGVDRCII